MHRVCYGSWKPAEASKCFGSFPNSTRLPSIPTDFERITRSFTQSPLLFRRNSSHDFEPQQKWRVASRTERVLSLVECRKGVQNKLTLFWHSDFGVNEPKLTVKRLRRRWHHIEAANSHCSMVCGEWWRQPLAFESVRLHLARLNSHSYVRTQMCDCAKVLAVTSHHTRTHTHISAVQLHRHLFNRQF